MHSGKCQTMPSARSAWTRLSEMIPYAKERYLGCRVLRTPIAYLVYLNEYEAERKAFGESTGIDGL